LKKKKKRIDTFKNWLLARDSSSRVSTFPKYHSFLESMDNSKRTMAEVMFLLGKISSNKPFFKLQKLIDYESYQDGQERKYGIKFSVNYFLPDLRLFMESFKIGRVFLSTFIKIMLKDSVSETEIVDQVEYNKDGYQFRRLDVEIPDSFDDSKIVEESEKCIQSWINGIEFGEEFLNDFFRWWMNNFLFVEDKWDNFLKYFPSALVEWMRQAPTHLVEQAYVTLVDTSKDTSFSRFDTELGNEEVISHVKQGIKEFGIEIGEVERGTDLLSKFGL
jgi:hypothetical protein